MKIDLAVLELIDPVDGLASARIAPVQLVADGSDANSSGVALGYASSLLAGYAARALLASALALCASQRNAP